MSNQGALATLDVDSAIRRLSEGAMLKTIASEFGVNKVSLRERLSKHPGYKQAIVEQSESFVEEATAECLDCPADMPYIARARLRLESAHKWAAARDPATWGRAGVQININNAILLDANAVGTIGDLLERIAEQQKGEIIEQTQSDEK